MIKVKLENGAVALKRANPLDSGLDLKARGYSIINIETNEIQEPVWFDKNIKCVEIKPMERILIKTGIHIEPEIPYLDEHENIYIIDLNVRNRSGLSIKKGLFTMEGTIDNAYRGDIGCMCINLSTETILVSENDAVGQLVLGFAVIPKEFQYVSKLNDSTRGTRGFGSSDA